MNSGKPVHNRFATTRWSIVMSAGDKSAPESRAALEKLCELYWTPLYAYVRRRVSTVAEAQDLTQAFFLAFLEKNYAATATPDRGRFRSFLLTAFRNFLSKEWEKARAQKRGGNQTILSLDFATADSGLRLDPASKLTPEQLYDQQWAITLLGRVLEKLREEFASDEDANRFQELQPFLIGDHSGVTYADTAERLNMNEPALRKAVSRLRARYREILRRKFLRPFRARMTWMMKFVTCSVHCSYKILEKTESHVATIPSEIRRTLFLVGIVLRRFRQASANL